MKRIVYIGNKLNHQKSTLTTIDTLSKLLNKEGHRIITASGKKNKFLRLADMLYTVLKNKNKADLVLIDTYSTQNFYFAVLVGRCCNLLSIPYIPILHGGNLPNRLKTNKRLSNSLFLKAKTNVSPSLFLKKAFNDYGYENVIHIPNSIEIEKYQFLIRKAEPTLLWVRSFSEIYNPLLALKILEKLLPEIPEISLCMVGPEKDGSLEKCKAYAIKKKLPVTFTEKLEKKDWIKLSENYSIFINTTNYDNTPVSVIEAMALGLAVVSANVGGIPFLLTDGEDALLVSKNSDQGFTNAIKKLLLDAELFSKMTINARKKAETFDWKKVKHQWTKLLNE